jgi:hypothetical protein
VLDQSDQFELRQALSELFLLVHLRENVGSVVEPAHAPRTISHHDISARWGDISILIEIFCPVDLMGFQLVEAYTSTILKYLKINKGFELEVKIRPIAEPADPFYPYLIGKDQEVRCWLAELAGRVEKWLNVDGLPSPLIVDGTNETWHLFVCALTVHNDPSDRLILQSSATRSTDSRLFFECGSVEDAARSEWGKKLRRKLKQRQCGDPKQGRLRMLVVDFSMADTGWPDFICWPAIASRIAEVMHRLVQELDDPVPYDIVLPAQIGPVCGFAPPIWLSGNMEISDHGFLQAAGLTRPVYAKESDITDWGKALRETE